MKTIYFKCFIEFVTIFLLFMFCFFVCEACGILAPKPGIKPRSPAMESEFLATGLPGKSHKNRYLIFERSSKFVFKV